MLDGQANELKQGCVSRSGVKQSRKPWSRKDASYSMTMISVPLPGCVFLANSAFVQACVMWVTLMPLLFRFHHYARTRYGSAVSHM